MEKITKLNIGDVNEISENMTTTVMNIYQKCLKEKTECSNNTKLSGSDYFGMNNEDHLKRISADITFIPIYIQENNFKMFVVDSSHNKIEPLDGYHITFIEKYRHETILFSQFYNKKGFHANFYSTKT
nr:3629_t:CDS:2 [Entrophospora candida]